MIRGIDAKQLVRTLRATLEEIETWGSEIVVDTDYFRALSLSSAFATDWTECPEIEVGRLPDSLEFIESIDPAVPESIPVAAGLVWIADVLRAVAWATEARER